MRLPLKLIRVGAVPLAKVVETRNVSSLGVLFVNDVEMRIGEPIEYMISLPGPSNEGNGIRLRCLGKIVRHDRSNVAEQPSTAATLERYEFVREE